MLVLHNSSQVSNIRRGGDKRQTGRAKCGRQDTCKNSKVCGSPLSPCTVFNPWLGTTFRAITCPKSRLLARYFTSSRPAGTTGAAFFTRALSSMPRNRCQGIDPQEMIVIFMAQLHPPGDLTLDRLVNELACQAVSHCWLRFWSVTGNRFPELIRSWGTNRGSSGETLARLWCFVRSITAPRTNASPGPHD